MSESADETGVAAPERRALAELLARTPVDASAERVVDLGCGAGAAGALLRARFPTGRLLGVERDPDKARAADRLGTYDAVAAADPGAWRPDGQVDLIVSDGALRWIDPPGETGHERLFSALLARLRPGGALAVQMPRQEDAPSERLVHETARALFPDRAPARPPMRVAEPAFYADLLARRAAATDLWETTIWRRLEVDPQAPDAHPVRAAAAADGAFVDLPAFAPDERAAFLAAYDDALHDAYPLLIDDTVWMPYRRLFLVAVAR